VVDLEFPQHIFDPVFFHDGVVRKKVIGAMSASGNDYLLLTWFAVVVEGGTLAKGCVGRPFDDRTEAKEAERVSLYLLPITGTKFTLNFLQGGPRVRGETRGDQLLPEKGCIEMKDTYDQRAEQQHSFPKEKRCR
jgi:hypothetical protein